MYFVRMGQESDRRGISGVIVDSSYENLRGFGKSKEVWIDIFTPLLNPSQFMVTTLEQNENIVGIVGFADNMGYPVTIQKKIFTEKFGCILGNIMVLLLKDEFYHIKNFEDRHGHISFIGFMESEKGKGIIKLMVQELLKKSNHDRYTFCIIEGKEKLLSIYEKLGFQSIGRKKEKCGWLKGFSFRYVLELK